MPYSKFSLEITASDDDVDMLGHVSNIRYVSWVQLAGTSHSDARGFDLAAYREIGAIFIVRRHEIDYLRPAYAGDKIRLTTWIDTWKLASVIRMTTIERLARADGTTHDKPVTLAKGKTLWAFVGLDSGRPQRIPEPIRPPRDAPATSPG